MVVNNDENGMLRDHRIVSPVGRLLLSYTTFASHLHNFGTYMYLLLCYLEPISLLLSICQIII